MLCPDHSLDGLCDSAAPRKQSQGDYIRPLGLAVIDELLCIFERGWQGLCDNKGSEEAFKVVSVDVAPRGSTCPCANAGGTPLLDLRSDHRGLDLVRQTCRSVAAFHVNTGSYLFATY